MENKDEKKPIKKPVGNIPAGAKSSPQISKNVPKGVRPIKPQTVPPLSTTASVKTDNLKPNVKVVDSKNIEVKADDKENKKKKRKLLLLLLFLLLLLVGVGTAIYFIVRIPKTDMRFSIITETKFNNTWVDSGGDVHEKIYYPGDQVDAELKIKIQNDKGVLSESEKVFLRFRIDIIVDDNYYGGLFDPIFETQQDWTYHDADNYFYYNYFCYGNEEITPFEFLDFVGSRLNNALNGKTGKIIYTVEILEGNYSAINPMWTTAPSSWRPIKKA